jgi:uncharacterized DUF497 family protein
LTPGLYVDTLNHLRIVFDPAKDVSNTVKHGISLVEAARIEWDDAVTWLDTRHDYGEARMCAIATSGSVFFTWCTSIAQTCAVSSAFAKPI